MRRASRGEEDNAAISLLGVFVMPMVEVVVVGIREALLH